ncbi:MAG: SiaB family protein kinase [Flavobacteriales bacterium]|nr:SiaB family protein kinase [Flavobacteriales bacterium]
MSVDTNALVNSDTVLLHHKGAVDKNVVLDTLAHMEDILEAEHIDRQKKRKLVNIAIETLQNLQLHSYEHSNDAYADLTHFILTKKEGRMNIIIGNLVSNDETIVLEDKLKKINSLSDEEVKFLYGVIMKQTVVKFSTKGGAGLGLIDMKKKSGNPLAYRFQQVDDSVSFFSLRIEVDV